MDSLKIGTSHYANGVQEGDETVYSLFSIKDLTTYGMDYVKENLTNVDIKFHLQGASSAPRIYSMNNLDSKNALYKTSDGTALNTLLDDATTNLTKFYRIPGPFSFESATTDDVEALSDSIVDNAVKNDANPPAAGEVIAFKAGSTSTAAGSIGIFRIEEIVLTGGANKEKGYYVISVKRIQIESEPEPDTLVTEGFDYVESLKIGTSHYANGVQEGDETVYSLFSIKDLTTYGMDYVKENLTNVDIKFHLQGASSAPRIYSMNNLDSKNALYKTSDGTALNTLLDDATTNLTKFYRIPGPFSFESATTDDVEALSDSIVDNAVKNDANPPAAGEVIAFKAGSTSTAAGSIGIFRIEEIVLTGGANKEKGYYVISVKKVQSTGSSLHTPFATKNIWVVKDKSVYNTQSYSGQVDIYDITGKLVIQKNLQAGDYINMSGFKGIFLIKSDVGSQKIIL